MLGPVQRCDECDFTYEAVALVDTASNLRSLCTEYVAILADRERDQRLKMRPAPGVWSVIEYSCHVRDVVLIQRDRIILALVERSPGFARMYRDERALLAGYRQEAPQDVALGLGVAVNLFAHLFDRLSSEQTDRKCIYNFPEASERDIGWLGRHTVHEAKHHLDDVRRILTRLSN